MSSVRIPSNASIYEMICYRYSKLLGWPMDVHMLATSNVRHTSGSDSVLPMS